MLKKLLLITLSNVVLFTGCVDNRQGQPAPNNPTDDTLTLELDKQQLNKQTQPIVVNVDGDVSEEIPAYMVNEELFIPLSPVLEFIGYQVEMAEDRSVLEAGSTDVIYKVEEGSLTAVVEENELPLASPAVNINNELCLVSHAFQELMSISYVVDVTGGNVSITTLDEDLFEENDDLANLPDLTAEEMTEEELEEDIAAMSSTEASSIIRTARKYLGRPYVFGATTGNTRVFDCSSLTEYVYELNGINLPRVARAQARRGYSVSASNLRRGDLLFFNWPGRFRSNHIVGHVAIYIGNGSVIHATPSEGVHIANVARSSYWRSNYLGAKRVG